jgi:sodium-dependent dicarboxylate transporter 2/3/5
MAQEKISAAEERFEELRKKHGLWIGPLVSLLFFALRDDTPQTRLASILIFCGIWWFTEPVALAVTALFGAALVVLSGLATAKEAFSSFGTPLLFLFVGSFFLAEAMRRNGLGERIARFVTGIATGQISLLMTLSMAAFIISLWISNTAATAILLPVAISVARNTEPRYGAALVLSIAYGASVGGIGTPVGTPPNLIGIARIREAGVSINFLEWMSIGLPIGLLMLVFLWILLALRFSLKKNQPLFNGIAIGLAAEQNAASSAIIADSDAQPPSPPLYQLTHEHVTWQPAEKVVAAVFGVAVFAWITPGVLEALATLYPDLQAASKLLKTRITEEVVAICCATVLFVWAVPDPNKPGEKKKVLTWKEASEIDWGTILLFGGGILLGDLAGKTGLAASVGGWFVGLTGAESALGITALCTGISIIVSEATSNTAAATLMLPLSISLAEAAGIPILMPAMGATLGASFGFMLPISTAPNAMAYGTGKVSIQQMASAGVLFDILGFFVIVFGLWLLIG